MKKLIIMAISCAMIFACNQDKSKGDSQKNLRESSGKINFLTVVATNDQWNGNLGEAIRDILAAPVYGLPQDEPLFSMSQMPPNVFSGFAAQNRTVLKIEKGNPDMIIKENVYAKPQKVIVLKGNNDEEIINQLKTNAEKIVSTFKDTEITEKQRRINKSLQKIDDIEKNLGVTIDFASAYRISKKVQNDNDKFFWIRKNITTGSMNLLVYQVPLSALKKGDSTINDVIKMRDSIGKIHIPGPNEGSFQRTEPPFTPMFFKEIVDNKPTMVTKGTWDVDGATMAGPFINYAIEDKINNRYVILEGFTYAPSVKKRDFMFELEAIIKSVHIK